MPFKSKAQMKKFMILEKEGKLPLGTTRKWLSETKNFKKLPAHKKKNGKKRQKNK